MDIFFDYVQRKQFFQRVVFMSAFFTIFFAPVPGLVFCLVGLVGLLNKKIYWIGTGSSWGFCMVAVIKGLLNPNIAIPMNLEMLLFEPDSLRLLLSSLFGFFFVAKLPRYWCKVDKFIEEEERKIAMKSIKIENKELDFSKQSRTHEQIIGTTGSGKSSYLVRAIKNSLENNENLVIISGKSATDEEFSLLNQTRKMCAEHNRELVILSMNEEIEDRIVYNPFSSMKENAVADAVVNMTDYDTASEHYKNSFSLAITSICDVLKTLEVPFSIPAIAKMLDYDEIMKYAAKLIANGKIDDFTYAELKSSATAFKESQGSFIRLRKLMSGNIKYLFLGEKEKINVQKSVARGAVFFADLDFMSYKDTSDLVGRLLLSDIQNTINSLKKGKNTRIICDEVGKYAGDGKSLEAIYSMARSKDVQIMSAFQSYIQLHNGLKESIQANSKHFITFQTGAPSDAEEIANIIGTRTEVETTRKTDGAFADEQGTKKTVQKYKVPVDYIKELPQLTYLFYDKDCPKKVIQYRIIF